MSALQVVKRSDVEALYYYPPLGRCLLHTFTISQANEKKSSVENGFFEWKWESVPTLLYLAIILYVYLESTLAGLEKTTLYFEYDSPMKDMDFHRQYYLMQTNFNYRYLTSVSMYAEKGRSTP